MKNIKTTLEWITTTWNDFFWNNNFCQKEINFTTEIRTNYYGDILSYFNDTLDFFENLTFENDSKKSIFQAIGTLQTIYTHQDLIDELLYIFKLNKSTKLDKSPNREIRNELVGHPIRRINGELISSVFFGREFKNGTIHYILYSKDNQFKGREAIYSLPELIYLHKSYLENFTELIWKRIEQILRRLQKKLVIIKSLLKRNIQFDNIINVVDHYFNSIYSDNYLFKPAILSACFTRSSEHPRYKHTIDLFLTTLESYLDETVKSINELFSPTQFEQIKVYTPTSIISLVSVSDKMVPTQTKIEYLQYEFSKLFEKHPVFGIDYFIKMFGNDENILLELTNMKNHTTDNLEYYSSYEYLRVLLINKGHLRP